MNNIKFEDYLNEQLKDQEFKKAFDAEITKLSSAIALTNIRKQEGLSQRELSSISDVPQATIARIERGDNTSINTLTKLANAIGKKITISFS